MTPKEKAIELVEKYYHLFSVELENSIDYREAKQCALIAVNEILKSLKYPPKPNEHRQVVHIKTLEYWREVKQEIEKL